LKLVKNGRWELKNSFVRKQRMSYAPGKFTQIWVALHP